MLVADRPPELLTLQVGHGGLSVAVAEPVATPKRWQRALSHRAYRFGAEDRLEVPTEVMAATRAIPMADGHP